MTFFHLRIYIQLLQIAMREWESEGREKFTIALDANRKKKLEKLFFFNFTNCFILERSFPCKKSYATIRERESYGWKGKKEEKNVNKEVELPEHPLEKLSEWERQQIYSQFSHKSRMTFVYKELLMFTCSLNKKF